MHDIDIRRSEVKATIESFEHWCRRLINDEMISEYGKDYFDLRLPDGNNLIKKKMLDTIKNRMQENPKRYPRKIDAILLDDITYFFCREEFYARCFKKVFDGYFAGIEDIQLRMNALVLVRNSLSHGNPISFRDEEKAKCYTNDFIDAIKEYYIKIGREKEYNVPFFIKVEDNYGRCKYLQENKLDDLGMGTGILKLRPGEVYKIWIYADSNFPEDFYDIIWVMNDKEVGRGNYFEYHVTVKDVSRLLLLSCSLITKRQWHKYYYLDDSYSTSIGEVLPPVEDLY